jgi:hypothetical protein
MPLLFLMAHLVTVLEAVEALVDGGLVAVLSTAERRDSSKFLSIAISSSKCFSLLSSRLTVSGNDSP